MMKILKTAALALALTTPGMAMAATDGTLGATSTGSFNASITVTPNTDNHVQILGLEDVVFPGLVAGTQGPAGSEAQFFCLNKNTPGAVRLSVDKPSKPVFTGPEVYRNDLINGTNILQIDVLIREPINGFTPFSNGSWGGPATSPSTCSASSGLGIAYQMEIRLQANQPLVEGTYSNTFALTVAAQ